MRQMIGRGVALAGMLYVLSVCAHTVILESGRLHSRGQLVNGVCAVATNSQNSRVQMGQYHTNAFSGTRSFASISMPFSLRLTSCSSDVYDRVGTAFAGMAPAEDSQVSLTSSGVSAASGIDLALFDERQQQIIPNTLPFHCVPIIT